MPASTTSPRTDAAKRGRKLSVRKAVPGAQSALLRIIHVNDVYELDNLPRLSTLVKRASVGCKKHADAGPTSSIVPLHLFKTHQPVQQQHQPAIAGHAAPHQQLCVPTGTNYAASFIEIEDLRLSHSPLYG